MNDLTKQALAASLAKLLQERPIAQISVKDVCADCGLNRQTFYYHFQDIYDLMFWMVRKDIAAYYHSRQIAPSSMSDYLYSLFTYCQEHGRLVRHAYNSANRVRYEIAFRDESEPLLRRKLESYENYSLVAKEDADMLISFYAYSAAALFFRWVESGMPQSFSDGFSKYCMLLDESVNALLLKFSK